MGRMQPSPNLNLNDGRTIPQIGLGVYKVEDRHVAGLVAGALEMGYRHVDTASLYENERGVGEGVRASGVPREQVFVTTKLWNADQGRDSTLRAFDASLDRLGLDYVDLYLIHWPVPSRDLYVQTWRAFEELQRDGRALSIGVSNFQPHHIERLRNETDVLPSVNQVELHPWLQQQTVRDYHAPLGILTESWSPLARGGALGEEAIVRIAAKHGVTPAQVVIRWHVQLGNVVIPKSNSLERVRENFDVFGFELTPEDMAAIRSLDSGRRTGADPDLG